MLHGVIEIQLINKQMKKIHAFYIQKDMLHFFGNPTDTFHLTGCLHLDEKVILAMNCIMTIIILISKIKVLFNY